MINGWSVDGARRNDLEYRDWKANTQARVKTHQKIVSGILVDHLLKYRLIRRPFRLDFLHELVLSDHSFLDEELR